MTSTPTTRLRLEQQGQGDNLNTWGYPKLNTVIQKVDDGRGRAAISLTGLSAYTLTTLNYSSDDASKGVLVFTGTLSSNCVVTAPSVECNWDVDNQCTLGAYTLTIKTSGGTAITLPYGTSRIYSDGTTIKFVQQLDFGGQSLTSVGAVSMSGQITGLTSATITSGAVNLGQLQNAIATASVTGTTGTLMNSLSDTTPGYLSNKIAGLSPIVVATINSGSNEQQQVSIGTTGTAGSAGSNTVSLAITTDAYGRVTAKSTTPIGSPTMAHAISYAISL